uniref:Uncharacterized protein n=1 Tax=Plectus sambesii TaxID=2011161 RepID=A0A914VVC4_9BILA
MSRSLAIGVRDVYDCVKLSCRCRKVDRVAVVAHPWRQISASTVVLWLFGPVSDGSGGDGGGVRAELESCQRSVGVGALLTDWNAFARFAYARSTRAATAAAVVAFVIYQRADITPSEPRAALVRSSPITALGRAFDALLTARRRSALYRARSRNMSLVNGKLGAMNGHIQTASESKQPLADTCICNRPRSLVICRRCGYETEGRVRTTCLAHPNRQALMDQEVCPVCRASTLQEVRKNSN